MRESKLSEQQAAVRALVGGFRDRTGQITARVPWRENSRRGEIQGREEVERVGEADSPPPVNPIRPLDRPVASIRYGFIRKKRSASYRDDSTY